MKKICTFVAVFVVLVSGTLSIAAQVRTKLKPESVSKGSVTRFGRADAVSEGRGVYVYWSMDFERGNIGFNIYRISAKGREQITTNPILAANAARSGDERIGAEYGYFDNNGSIGDSYQIEAFDFRGSVTLGSTITAVYVNDFKAVSGRTAAELSKQYGKKEILLERQALTLPKELDFEVQKYSSIPDMSNQRQVVSQAGVKIGIKSDGFYRVTRTELQAAGFDPASDRNYWQLYRNGVEQAILVEPAGDYIEFVGKASETVETDVQAYFLVLGAAPGKRMTTSIARPSGSSVASRNYQTTYFKKERVNYIYDILNGDAENFWGNLIYDTPTTFNFTLTGIDTAATTAVVRINAQGFSLGSHSITFVMNGHTLPVMTGSGEVPMGTIVSVPTDYLSEGTNTLQMATAGGGDYGLFDNISVDYSRKFAADQNQISFYTTNYRNATLTGFASANVRVFDTTREGEPVQLVNFPVSQNGAAFDVKLPGARGRVMYAVENSAVKQAYSVKQNLASDLTGTSNSAKLVIITYGAFRDQAVVWKQYRERIDFPVMVVDVDDIFDEFNFGQAGADPIRAFINHAITNWQVPPAYVLLLGDASFDPKNYTGFGYTNLIPAKMIATVYEETGSDEALADLNWDGLAELAIGRIPAKTPQDVTNAFAKVVAFETPTIQDLNRGALFAYDLPSGYDFQGMSVALRNQLPPTMPVVMVGRGDPNAQVTLLNEMNTGKYIVNYSGHGSTGLWASTSFFGVNNVASLTNANNQSIFTMLTCLNGYYINPYNESLGERLLKATNGGSVVSWASAGRTTPDIQSIMALRFYQQIGLGNIKRIGDLVKDAKTVIPGGSDVRFSWALLADPMLQVRP